MTFCIGIKVREGIVALADTRIVRGSEQTNKGKLAPFPHEQFPIFTMTSGLRSVRDKTLVYVQEVLREQSPHCDWLYQFANLFGEQLRRVKREDGPSLAATNHSFNLHAIIGGKLSADDIPEMFYLFPEGNWVEASPDSPYFIIGRTYYGKPILDRLLKYETPLSEAIALAFLAFDATRTSVTDVDFPIDLAVMSGGNPEMQFARYQAKQLDEATQWWTRTLKQSLQAMPMEWASRLSVQSNPNNLQSNSLNTDHETNYDEIENQQ